MLPRNSSTALQQLSSSTAQKHRSAPFHGDLHELSPGNMCPCRCVCGPRRPRVWARTREPEGDWLRSHAGNASRTFPTPIHSRGPRGLCRVLVVVFFCSLSHLRCLSLSILSLPCRQHTAHEENAGIYSLALVPAGKYLERGGEIQESLTVQQPTLPSFYIKCVCSSLVNRPSFPFCVNSSCP